MLNITKTKEEITKDKLIEIDENINTLSLVLKGYLKELRGRIFNDKEITAQEFFDVIGTKAKDVIDLMEETQATLVSVKPETPALDLPKLTWKDGKVESVEIVEKSVLPVDEIML